MAVIDKLHNNPKNKLNPFFIYIFFLFHMGVFGTVTFFLFYGKQELDFAYLWGGFSIFIYLIFYLVIFGIDRIKWLLINSALGILGIYAMLDNIASVFIPDAPDAGIITEFSDFPYYIHIFPGIFIILYEFMLRNFMIDLTGARKNPERLRIANPVYIAVSIIPTIFVFLFQ